MKNIFDWNKIYTNKTSGKTKATCPECIDSRTNKKDKSLQVNFDNGIAHCHYCHAISFRDSIERKTESQNFKLPVQTWRNYTNLSEPMVKWLEKRKISQSTAIAFGLTEEKYYQPQLQKEVNNLVFNYFEGDILINKKYRSGDKKFTQTAGAKSIFYNLNAIIGQEEVYIVEGELDCISMAEIGIKNCISLPNGANDNDTVWINCEKYLKDVKKFLIATDNDDKGNEVADKIAQRLGRWRCERVVFSHKDANDDLIDGSLKNSVLNRIKYPVSGTFSVMDLYNDIIDLYNNGLPDTIYPKHPSFGNLKNIFSVMRGHLITGTGIPSHGKSEFTEWYVLNLVKDYNMKASFFSPEHLPLQIHKTRFIEKTFGKNFWSEVHGVPRITTYDISKYAEWANEKIYLTSPENGEIATWDWILEKFKEQMVTYGTDIFVIDAFNKVSLNSKTNPLPEINNVLAKLTSFAQSYNVIIFLVAHPTKMRKGSDGLYAAPSLYDVSGSADFRNQTHDGFSIYRYFGDEENEAKIVFENLKTKMKFQGEIGGQVEFDYHIPSGRYFEFGTEYYPYNLITWDQEPQLITLEEIPNVFDDQPLEEEDVPF
jgi:twinkle protein